MTDLNKETIKELLKKVEVKKNKTKSFDIDRQVGQHLLGLAELPILEDDHLKLLGIKVTFDRSNNEYYRFQSMNHLLKLRKIIKEYFKEQE